MTSSKNKAKKLVEELLKILNEHSGEIPVECAEIVLSHALEEERRAGDLVGWERCFNSLNKNIFNQNV